MCTTDHTLTLTRADGAVDITVSITRPAVTPAPGEAGAVRDLVADADGPRIDTIGIDEVLPPGDAGDIRPAGAGMEALIGALIDDYKTRTLTALEAPGDDAAYLSGVTEGLRIARRVVIRPAVKRAAP